MSLSLSLFRIPDDQSLTTRQRAKGRVHVVKLWVNELKAVNFNSKGVGDDGLGARVAAGAASHVETVVGGVPDAVTGTFKGNVLGELNNLKID